MPILRCIQIFTAALNENYHIVNKVKEIDLSMMPNCCIHFYAPIEKSLTNSNQSIIYFDLNISIVLKWI